jgi:hypothetical protein
MLVAPAEDAAASVVLPLDRVMIEVLFSCSMFASPTPPTSQLVVRVGRRGGRVVRRVSAVGVVRPVLERRGDGGRAVRAEVAVRVRDGLPVPVGIGARERAENPAARVRDEDGVVVRVERPVALHEVQQVRHLLEIRGDVRVVPLEVHVVELEVDDVLDLSVVAELTGRPRGGPAGYVISCGCKL